MYTLPMSNQYYQHFCKYSTSHNKKPLHRALAIIVEPSQTAISNVNFTSNTPQWPQFQSSTKSLNINEILQLQHSYWYASIAKLKKPVYYALLNVTKHVAISSQNVVVLLRSFIHIADFGGGLICIYQVVSQIKFPFLWASLQNDRHPSWWQHTGT